MDHFCDLYPCFYPFGHQPSTGCSRNGRRSQIFIFAHTSHMTQAVKALCKVSRKACTWAHGSLVLSFRQRLCSFLISSMDVSIIMINLIISSTTKNHLIQEWWFSCWSHLCSSWLLERQYGIASIRYCCSSLLFSFSYIRSSSSFSLIREQYYAMPFWSLPKMMMRTQNTSNKVQRILQMMRNIQAHLCRKYDKKDVLTVDKSSFSYCGSNVQN